MKGYFWTLHCPRECLVVIKFYYIILLSFLQELLDCDVRRRVRFGFKSKGLRQQKLKNAIYNLTPGELTECSEDLSRWIHIKRSHCMVGEEENSFGKARVQEQDLLLLPRTADNGRKNWIYSALMAVTRVQCYKDKLGWRFIRRNAAVVMWVVKSSQSHMARERAGVNKGQRPGRPKMLHYVAKAWVKAGLRCGKAECEDPGLKWRMTCVLTFTLSKELILAKDV